VRYSDIPRLLTMAAVWLLLVLWYFMAPRGGCILTLGLVVAFTLILLMSGAEIALAKRQAFLGAFVVPGSRLHRLLSLPALLLAIEALMAAILALFLLAVAVTFASRQWSVLFADVLFMGLLLPRLYAGLEGQVVERYRFATARRWTMWASVVLLWLESLVVLVFSAGDSFMGLRWQEVIAYAAVPPAVACPPMAQMAALVAAVDALGQWSVQNLQRNLSDLPQALMAATGVLASVSMSFLSAYVFSRALVGVVARPWDMWSPDRAEGASSAATRGSAA
jgi:hypothetical protein